MTKQAEKRWWEILRGLHSEGGRTYCPNTIDEETLEETPQESGPYIHTTSDLSKFNPPSKAGYVQRFRPMTEGEAKGLGLVPPDAEEDKPDLSQLTLPRLRIFAEENQVDVSGLSTKAEIVEALRNSDLVNV